MEEIDEDNSTIKKCNHDMCKTCINIIIQTHIKTDSFNCPICTREYSSPRTNTKEFKQILFNIVFFFKILQLEGYIILFHSLDFASKYDILQVNVIEMPGLTTSQCYLIFYMIIMYPKN